jgi:hypothetical protein
METSLSASAKGLTLLRTTFQKHPDQFSDLAHDLVDVYLLRARALNRLPDTELLKPYLDQFNWLNSPEQSTP